MPDPSLGPFTFITRLGSTGGFSASEEQQDDNGECESCRYHAVVEVAQRRILPLERGSTGSVPPPPTTAEWYMSSSSSPKRSPPKRSDDASVPGDISTAEVSICGQSEVDMMFVLKALVQFRTIGVMGIAQRYI